MVAQARAISYGINSLRYLTGESHKKNHPEKIHHITDLFLTPDLDSAGIWNEMKQTTFFHQKMKKNVISFEISPPREYTKDFSVEDWQQLWNDFAEEFDTMEIKDKNQNVISGRTNISRSKATVWLHEDSKSGIPHLHAAVCRVDENGKTNNDHLIHIRAQAAAERVAKKRGWKTAEEVRADNKKAVSKDCLAILREMKEFSIEKYFDLLKRKGYEVKVLMEKLGQMRGYSLKKDKAHYKASELGTGRNLMISKIENTWKKLHPELNPGFVYTKARPDRTCVEFWYKDNRFRRFIPNTVVRLFQKYINRNTASNWQSLLERAYYHFSVAKTFLTLVGFSGEGSGENREYEVGQNFGASDLELEIGMKCIEAAFTELGRKRSRGLGI